MKDEDPANSMSTTAPQMKKIKSKKKTVPTEGDPDYLSPTQLRNRRKRRAKQQKKGSSNSHHSKTLNTTQDDTSNLNDPSMKYISNPKNTPIVQTAKRYFQSIDSKHTMNTMLFKVHLGPLYRWRTVSKLAVRASSDSTNDKPKVAIGLFLPQSHTLLPVPNCKAHHPSINQVVECVTHACHLVGVEPYQESNGKQTDSIGENEKGRGHLRYIGVNIERKTGAAQITLVWNGNPPDDSGTNVEDGCNETDPRLAKLVTKILSMANTKNNDSQDSVATGQTDQPSQKKRRRRGNREGKQKEETNITDTTGCNASNAEEKAALNLHSIWVNYNLSWKHSNAIFAFDSTCWKHIYGPPAIIEHLEFSIDSTGLFANPPPAAYPIPLHFSPNVFRQANLDAFTNIVGRIRERVITVSSHQERSSNLPTCIEFYGGVGTIGLHLSDIVSSLVSSDENPNNLKCFNKSVSTFPSDVQSRLEYKQKNAENMVASETGLLKKCNILVLDPPRKGLDGDVLDYLCQTGWQQSLNLVIYVSCGFQAFQRDCDALLKSEHWRLEFAEGYLLFPGCDAIETLAFFVPS